MRRDRLGMTPAGDVLRRKIQHLSKLPSALPDPVFLLLCCDDVRQRSDELDPTRVIPLGTSHDAA